MTVYRDELAKNPLRLELEILRNTLKIPAIQFNNTVRIFYF